MGAHGSTWNARLDLRFDRIAERTALVHRRHEGPLGVQRPFYPEGEGVCHVYLLHPPGGVVGGDDLSVSVDSALGAHALVTTPAATKLYRSDGRVARQRQRLRVAAGGRLEWLPQETIAFDGADAVLSTEVELEPEASFVGWDIVCLGRPAVAELFSPGRIDQRFTIRRGNRLLWHERADYRGGHRLLDAEYGLRGEAVVGSLVCVTPNSPELLAEVRASIADAGPLVAASHLEDVLVVRLLGGSVESARRAFEAVWTVLRRQLWAMPAEVPRIWLT